MIAKLKVHIRANSKIVFQDLTYKSISILLLSLYFYLPFLYRYEITILINRIFKDEKWASFWVPLIMNFAALVLSNIVYSTIYCLNHPFLEKYKTIKGRWPWQIDNVRYRAKYWKAVRLVLLNYLIIAPTLQYLLVNVLGLITSSNISNLDPSFLSYMGKILFMIICDDMHSYWVHKLMHTKYFYSGIHSVHHQFSTTVVISSEYTHPLEFIIMDFTNVMLGELLLGGTSLITLSTFIFFKSIEASESHGGYEFPWSFTRMLPFCCTSDYHDYHHRKGKANYGSFWIFWDSVFGDNDEYYRTKKN